jgi:hypothetical protein
MKGSGTKRRFCGVGKSFYGSVQAYFKPAHLAVLVQIAKDLISHRLTRMKHRYLC